MLSLMLVAALAIGTLATPAVAYHHQLIDAGIGRGALSRGSSTTGCADDGRSYVSGSSTPVERPDSWSHFELGQSYAWVDSVDGRQGAFLLCGELDYDYYDSLAPTCVVHNGKGSIQMVGEQILWLRNVQSYDAINNGDLPDDVGRPNYYTTIIRGDVVAAADAAAAAAMTPRHSFYAEIMTNEFSSLCHGGARNTFTMRFLITEKSVEDLTTP